MVAVEGTAPSPSAPKADGLLLSETAFQKGAWFLRTSRLIFPTQLPKKICYRVGQALQALGATPFRLGCSRGHVPRVT